MANVQLEYHRLVITHEAGFNFSHSTTASAEAVFVANGTQ